MSSVFTDDIIYEIFKLLKDTDVYGNSLYSCLYVNRRFCVIAAPFLWKTTFQKEAKSNIFISTYISCLNKRFHGWQNDNDRSLLLSGRFLTMSPPLFDEDPKKKSITSKLEFYLFKMFAERSALESLAIELDVENCWKIKEVFLGGISRVSSIKNLSISFPTLTLKEPRFLSKVRRFLRELKIVFQNLDEVCFFVDEASDSNDLISQSSVEIISFVQNQKNLKGFNLIGGEDKFLPAKDIITSSLKAHANSLIHLNVDNVHFSGMSFSFFEKCCKLELLAGESLVELDIDDVSNEISEVLVTYCTKIETLSISGKTKLALPWLSKLRNLKRLEFMQVAEMCNFDESEMSVLPSNIKIKKIITELFMTEFDCFYKSTQHLDFSLVSIIFSPEVKDFESISYEDLESSLEINIGSSGGTNPTEEYKHITIKKKRSDVLLNFHYLSEKLLAKEN
ncbi:unnamed protein product [Rhizophagus irregularis]|nr:unnamed protein product [Rhizophagus irregularis]